MSSKMDTDTSDVSDSNAHSNGRPVSSSQPTSLVRHILDSLFSPGLNSPTRSLMNWSFYGLFFTLLGLLPITGSNIHILYLLAVAVALWASVNWFLYELAKMPPSVRQTQQIHSLSSDGVEKGQ